MKSQCDRHSAQSALLATGIEYPNLRKRSSLDREATRKSITMLVTTAFQAAFPAATENCAFVGTSSGVDAVFPPTISNSDLLTKFLPKLELGLEEMNNRCSSSTGFRLRAVFDLGEDALTSTGSGVASRLLASNFLRLFVTALPRTRSVAVLVSDGFYRSALPARTGTRPGFKRARIQSEAKNPVIVWAYRYPQLEA